jgi:hypothetical protein
MNESNRIEQSNESFMMAMAAIMAHSFLLPTPLNGRRQHCHVHQTNYRYIVVSDKAGKKRMSTTNVWDIWEQKETYPTHFIRHNFSARACLPTIDK